MLFRDKVCIDCENNIKHIIVYFAKSKDFLPLKQIPYKQ